MVRKIAQEDGLHGPHARAGFILAGSRLGGRLAIPYTESRVASATTGAHINGTGHRNQEPFG